MIPRPAIYLLGFVLWSAAMVGAGWVWRGDRAERDVAVQQVASSEQSLQVEQQARQIEHDASQKLAAIGESHEQDRIKAEAVPDAVVAELRAGTIRLRHDLATCHTGRLSEAAASAGERDATTQRREEFASRVVRIGRDADDQLRACQAIVRSSHG